MRVEGGGAGARRHCVCQETLDDQQASLFCRRTRTHTRLHYLTLRRQRRTTGGVRTSAPAADISPFDTGTPITTIADVIIMSPGYNCGFKIRAMVTVKRWF